MEAVSFIFHGTIRYAMGCFLKYGLVPSAEWRIGGRNQVFFSAMDPAERYPTSLIPVEYVMYAVKCEIIVVVKTSLLAITKELWYTPGDGVALDKAVNADPIRCPTT